MCRWKRPPAGIATARQGLAACAAAAEMSALVARTASFGRKKKSTTSAAAAAPVRAAGSADAPPPPSATGRAARVANALEARSMLLPGVSAAGLPTQNDDMWDGLQEGTDVEFEEAANAYVEVCNNAQVQTASLHWPHARASMTIRARVYTRTHERARTRAPHPRPTPALGTCHAQPSPQPSPRVARERRERRLASPARTQRLRLIRITPARSATSSTCIRGRSTRR